jgi:hypothetical protein
LKVVLYVPVKNESPRGGIWEKKVAKYAKDVRADLAVFPEEYITNCAAENAVSRVRKLAEKIELPVLCGVKSSEGYQLGVFCNLRREPGETEQHLYVKHSSADKLAYD